MGEEDEVKRQIEEKGSHGQQERPRFNLGKQSSLKPSRGDSGGGGGGGEAEELAAAAVAAVAEDPRIGLRLMYVANDGDMEGIEEVLDSGTNANFHDCDGRTALHVAACQGHSDVVRLLLRRGASVDLKDRWGSTPLADAVYYCNKEVIKILEEHGAKPPVAPMHVENAGEVPEYEIDPKELDFSNSIHLDKGTFRRASWRGIDVAVKTFEKELFTDEYKVKAFRDELALLQKLRHPNIVQFLGAVTQSTPMMIVTEYLPKGDFRAYLERKNGLNPTVALKFSLDIARGMSYLHEHKPEAIIHRDLEPSNLLRDDTGILKVADFGLSKILKYAKTIKEVRPVICEDAFSRYVAPEVYKNEEYDTKVDVFSFALILQEMIEGQLPFSSKPQNEVPKAYAANERPPFNAPQKCYAHGLKELIVDCWNEKPSSRPTFRQIILRLENIDIQFSRKKPWRIIRPLRCFRNFEALLKRGRSNSSTRSRSRSAR